MQNSDDSKMDTISNIPVLVRAQFPDICHHHSRFLAAHVAQLLMQERRKWSLGTSRNHTLARYARASAIQQLLMYSHT